MADFLDQVKTDLEQRGRVTQVAEATGIPIKTLRKIRYGVTTNPRYQTVEKLRAFYRAQQALAQLEQLQAHQPSRSQMG